MLLGVIGSRFRDAGRRELAVQNDIVAKVSVDKTLNGKRYNRAVRLHKCKYKALTRLLLKEFESLFQSFPAVNLEQLILDPQCFGALKATVDKPFLLAFPRAALFSTD